MKKIWMLAFPLLLLGCESSPTFPTEAEGDPPFSRVAWDMSTFSPAPGSTFNVGDAFSYNAHAFFEFAPEDGSAGLFNLQMLTLRTSTFVPILDMWIGGAVVQLMDFPGITGSSHELAISGSMQVPRYNTFCQGYDALSLEAGVWFDLESPQPGTEKGQGYEYKIQEDFFVEGATGFPDGPCTYLDPFSGNLPYAWGEPVEDIQVGGVDPAQDVDVIFGDGNPAIIWNRRDESFGYGLPTLTHFDVIVPAGAPGGDLKVFVDGEPTELGAGLHSQYPIPVLRDYGDPANDLWTQAEEDLWYFPGNVPFWGPELAFSEQDRIPDPEANPFGTDAYGRGDWWLLPIEADHRLCIMVESDRTVNDDFDTVLVDNTGNPVPVGFYDGGYFEWLELDVQVGDELRLWVAPRSIQSDVGWYGIMAQECSLWVAPPPTQSAESMNKLSVRAPAFPPNGVRQR